MLDPPVLPGSVLNPPPLHPSYTRRDTVPKVNDFLPNPAAFLQSLAFLGDLSATSDTADHSFLLDALICVYKNL